MAEIKWIKLSVNMFDDEKIKLIEKMPEADSIIVIWIKLLALAGRSNMSGYIMLTESIPYTEDMLVAIIDRPLQTIRLALATFERFGMLENSDSGAFYLTNWEKHQNIDGLDRIRAQTQARVAKHRAKAKALSSGNVTCNATVTQGNATDIDLEKEYKRSSRQKYDETDRYMRMARYFHEKVMEQAEANRVAHLVKEPNFQKWADEFRKIMELDKRDSKELQAVIDWCTADPFWSTNILSPKKLRVKYTELALKMQVKPKSSTNRTESNKELLRRRMTEVQNEPEGDNTSPFVDFNRLPIGSTDG